VADNPESVRASYKIEGINKSLTHNELIDHFAPTLYFEKDDLVQFPYNASTMYGSKKISKLDRNSSIARGDSETYLDGVAARPYPQGDKAYASILEKDIVTIRDKNGGRDSVRELAINYYFFYPISDWGKHGGFNTHEGDWEGITVFLRQVNSQFVPNRIAYAQHLNPKLIPWNQVSLQENSSHSKVFVGLGGHASYPNSGITNVRVPVLNVRREDRVDKPSKSTTIATLPELHRGGISPVSLQGKIEYLPHVSQHNSNHWLFYSGHWGHPKLAGMGSNAPKGPLYLDTNISYKESVGRGVRWLDPWAWAR
jgi:hypothetical protein